MEDQFKQSERIFFHFIHEYQYWFKVFYAYTQKLLIEDDQYNSFLDPTDKIVNFTNEIVTLTITN